MNPRVKPMFLEALRSGKYKQARMRMRVTYEGKNAYCCLGVLCDLLQPNNWSQSAMGSWTHSGATEYPSEAILREAGLEFNQAKHLAGMNDQRDTFAEIADYVESEL